MQGPCMHFTKTQKQYVTEVTGDKERGILLLKMSYDNMKNSDPGPLLQDQNCSM